MEFLMGKSIVTEPAIYGKQYLVHERVNLLTFI